MSRSKKPVNPAAQKALDQLKEETAAEIGLKDYKNTYKGALTSADNGRVGGQMVRKMIQAQEQQFSGSTAGQFGTTGQTQTTGQTLTAQYDVNQKS
jgi:hypothetical protein